MGERGTTDFYAKKSAGVLLPLFSMRSETDWGVGDFEAMEQWLKYFAATGTAVLQILPINEMSPYRPCPYNAISGFAIDPVYIAVNRVPDVAASQSASAFAKGIEPLLNIWRKDDKVNYMRIRDAKLKTLWHAYKQFLKTADPARKLDFQNFTNKNDAIWLHPYALFRCLKDMNEWSGWMSWPEEYRIYNKEAFAEFSEKNKIQINFYKYLQWLAETQILSVKKTAAENNILIFGDIPFSLNDDSADVWSDRENFNLNTVVGAPPDQFSTEGQKWGLAAYNWPAVQAGGFEIWRRKITRACELYDLFRLDHVVGFFRTFVYNPEHPEGYFDELDENKQQERGWNFLTMSKKTANGALPVAEDLGLIPDYVRRIMHELSIPGYKILRWEHDHGYYREPRNYPQVSVAAFSTHDTEPLKLWWEEMPAFERANIWEMCSAQKTDGNVPFNLYTQEVLLRRLLTSGSALVMFSVQDILGLTDRVNTPNLVDSENWSFRLDALPSDIEEKFKEETELYKKLLEETGRKRS